MSDVFMNIELCVRLHPCVHQGWQWYFVIFFFYLKRLCFGVRCRYLSIQVWNESNKEKLHVLYDGLERKVKSAVSIFTSRHTALPITLQPLIWCPWQIQFSIKLTALSKQLLMHTKGWTWSKKTKQKNHKSIDRKSLIFLPRSATLSPSALSYRKTVPSYLWREIGHGAHNHNVVYMI